MIVQLATSQTRVKLRGASQCVEVANLDDSRAVRDSKDPTGPALMFTAAQWVVFTAGVRAGEFD